MNIKETKNYSFRLATDTLKLLTELKRINGENWNLFINKLITEHANNHKNYYREFFSQEYKKHKKDNCEICGKEEEYKKGGYLVIHHIDGDITNNNINNLQTICYSCHGKQYPR